MLCTSLPLVFTIKKQECYALYSPMASFPQASPPTPCAHLYPPPYAPHALPISFVSILPPAQYWVFTSLPFVIIIKKQECYSLHCHVYLPLRSRRVLFTSLPRVLFFHSRKSYHSPFQLFSVARGFLTAQETRSCVHRHRV